MTAAAAPGANRPPLLEIEAAGKIFGRDTVALEGFSLKIGQGEFLTLLGPSGCGKSTVLRLIAGLIRPTTGRLRWSAGGPAGAAPKGPPEPRPNIPPEPPGFVFQDPTLMPWATVAENVWLPLRLRGRNRREAAPEIAEALSLVGLDGVAGAYPRELSGGMRMRVAIARALVTRPRLILMDEPFAALDEITRFRLNDDLLSLRQTFDCTVIFVTHSVYEAVFLSERVAVMRSRPGRVHRELTIPLPYPRDAAFRGSPAYAELCREASGALAEAMDAAP